MRFGPKARLARYAVSTAFMLFVAGEADAGSIDFNDHPQGPLQTEFFESSGVIFNPVSPASLTSSVVTTLGRRALIGKGDTPGTISGSFVTPVLDLSVRVGLRQQGTVTYKLSVFDSSSTLITSQLLTVTTDTGDPDNTGFRYHKVEIHDLSIAASSFTISNSFVRSSHPDVSGINFGLTSMTFCPVLDRIPIDIDVKPGSDPNSINLQSNGVIPVAIMTTDDFDVLEIDDETLRFGDDDHVCVVDDGIAPVRVRLNDVDRDGDLDLLVFFSTAQARGVFSRDSFIADLTGSTLGGVPFSGMDLVRVVPPKK